MTSDLKQINVTLPMELLDELRHYVPRQERNEFIVRLIEKELRRIRLRKALHESAGAWSDEKHPDLMTTDDVNQYVRQMRDRAMPRSWDEIIGEEEPDD